MASFSTNKGKADIVTVGWPNGDYRVIAVDTPPASALACADLNFVSEIVIDEVAGAGRQALLNKVVRENDTDDRSECDADDPATYTGLNGPTMAGLYCYRFVTGDADSPLIGFVDHNDVVTNGGDVAVAFTAAGIITFAAAA